MYTRLSLHQCMSARGLGVEHILGTIRLFVHFQRIILGFRELTLKSPRKTLPRWSPGTTCGAQPGSFPPGPGAGATNLPAPGAGAAAVQGNVYFLSLITLFFLSLSQKKKSLLDPRLVFMIQSDKTEHMLV